MADGIKQACSVAVASGDAWRRRMVWWWTGSKIDEAWTALHRAGQGLVMIQSASVLEAQMGDLEAEVVANIDPKDVRLSGYVQTINALAQPGRVISDDDRVHLRIIRQVADSAGDAAHSDARTVRNTLIEAGCALVVALGIVGVVSWGGGGFRGLCGSGGGQGPARR